MQEREPASNDHAIERARQPYRVRLPIVIADQDLGLGDVVKRAPSAVGIKPWGGCERCAAALNRRLVFSNGRRVHQDHTHVAR